MKLTKADVATRQLDTAIRLFFNAGDVVSVHTLVAASATVFADILDKMGETSWRQQMIAQHSGYLSKKQVISALRKAQNFFKHADRAYEKSIEFLETENDSLILIATLEAGLLLQVNNLNRSEKPKPSTPMSVFQLWYIATKPDGFYVPEELVAATKDVFPNINKSPRFEQLSIGASFLKEREILSRRRPLRVL